MMSGAEDPLELTRQRTVRRSRLFVALPFAIIGVLAANLAWEVVRTGNRWSWPSVADTSTTLGLMGAAVGLVLARLQWVRTVRPTLGMSVEPRSGSEPGPDQVLDFTLVNAGPGIAIMRRLDFRVVLGDVDHGFVDLPRLRVLLGDAGWAADVDYWLKWITPGAPITVHSTRDDATRVACFTVRLLKEVGALDVRVRVQDIAGDTHERIFPCLHFIQHKLAS